MEEPRAVGDLEHVEKFFARNLGGLIRVRQGMPASTAILQRPPSTAILTSEPVVGPMFDCAKNTASDEVAICGSKTLSLLDRQMAVQYGKARNGLDGAEQETLRNEQRSWLRRRTACQKNEDCIADAYRLRIAELGQWHKPPSVQDFITKVNRDMTGQDIRLSSGRIGIKIRNIDACAAECDSRSECRAFSFDRWNGVCFPKKGIVASRLDPRSVIGVKIPSELPNVSRAEPKMMPKAGHRFPGEAIAAERV